MKKINIALIGLSLFAISCASKKADPLPAGCATTIFFATDIKPIIDSNCVSCHQAGGSGTGDYTVFSELKAAAVSGTIKNRVFVLKDMPPAGSTTLTPDQLTKLNCWIQQGAPNN
jgi:uncharacterized membrane protein